MLLKLRRAVGGVASWTSSVWRDIKWPEVVQGALVAVLAGVILSALGIGLS